MHRAIAILLLSALPLSALASPHDIEARVSPDKRFEVSVRYTKAPGDDTKGATIYLRDRRTGKVIQTLNPQVDDSDFHNSVSVTWSPDSRYLAVTTQLAQLCGFAIYHLDAGRLHPLSQRPIPKEFEPEHRRSRGGPQFQQWLDNNRFTVFDSSCETEFTYRITKQADLLVTAAKETNQ